MSDIPSLKTRIAIMGFSTVVTALACEGLIRIVDGNATPMIRLFEADESGHVGLQTSGRARIARANGQPWEINTDAAGRRISAIPVSSQSWIAVGDSQVMGNGVSDEDNFPAQLMLDGSGVHNLGVPGYGIGDALWSATQHLDEHAAAGVIVVVNQMNDWEEVDRPVGERYRVRGGWLIDAEDADTARGRFLASPLSRSHLAFLIGHLALKDRSAAAPPAPNWMIDPVAMRHSTALFANAIKAFSDAHPGVRVLPVYLPADVYAAEGRADKSPLSPHLERLSVSPWNDTQLRDQVMTAMAEFEPIDLTPVLSEAAHFLEGDYHLSESGHKAVADAIRAAVERAPDSGESASPTPEKQPRD